LTEPGAGACRLAVFLATSGHSGVDRIAKNLLPSIAERGVEVDLLHVQGHGPRLDDSHDNIRMIELGTSHVYSSVGPVLRYLRRERPQVLLSAKDRVNRVAILARMLSGVPTRGIVRVGTTVSMDLVGRRPVDRLLTGLSMRYLYRRADRIVLPSASATEDFLDTTGLPAGRVLSVPSPVVTPGLFEKASRPPEHPWLAKKEGAVIVGIGELCARKDFAMLIRAFASVRKSHPAKLVIFGEGNQRRALESLIGELGLAPDVDLPGFVDNPYGALARANLYVHSARFEGSPVALMEAVALGVPSVSTNCPSGPAEILQAGEYGELVAVGDADAMARAIQNTLDAPLARDHIKRAAEPYTVEASTDAYMSALGIGARFAG
jgi:glycosyltransferase involved in cell wall biosynthesis